MDIDIKVYGDYGGLFMSTERKQPISESDLEYLRQYPQIFKDVRENRITCTFQFRMAVWNENHEPTPSTVRKVMYEFSQDPDLAKIITKINKDVIRHVAGKIRKNGVPRNGKNEVFGVQAQVDNDEEYSRYLIETGYAVTNRRGITFTDKLHAIVVARSEGVSVEEALKQAGLDPSRMGYQRIRKLIRDDESGMAHRPATPLTETDKELLVKSPWIIKVTDRQIRYAQDFNSWAIRFRHHLSCDEVLISLGLPPSELSDTARFRLYSRIRTARMPKKAESGCPELPEDDQITLNLLHIYCGKLTQNLDEAFRTIGTLWASLNCQDKLTICTMIEQFAQNDGFSLTWLLKKCSIPRSTYYQVMKDGYGQGERKKEERDRADAELIREIIEYKGFRKGSRQIRLQLKKRKGIRMSRTKILRLIRKYHLIDQEIRPKTAYRQEFRRRLGELIKPNLLQRQFRLNRPGEVILTDVSYLNYGCGQRAYLSALKDPASGKIHALLVSDSQDLDLGKATIDSLPHDSAEDCPLFHSDQGALYLNPDFQKQLSERGYEQSMSRRGNCWDNSSMESFFGHFKDECLYGDCQTLEEVRKLAQEYAFYYNEERPQPGRKNMTPAEFEKYLLDLDGERWDQYLSEELEKYNRMLQKAAQTAIRNARRDKAAMERSRYGQKISQNQEISQE